MAWERVCEVEFDRRYQSEVALTLMAEDWRVRDATRRYPDVGEERVVLAARSIESQEPPISVVDQIGRVFDQLGVADRRMRSHASAALKSSRALQRVEILLDGDAFGVNTLAYAYETLEEIARHCADAMGVDAQRLRVVPS